MRQLAWRKSSFSGDDASRDCIEIADAPDGTVRIRESDSPRTVVTTETAALRKLLLRIKRGALKTGA
ncbi:DUF397 domain-containing protein [Streptomyces sp. NPDC003077]|uniref:DUF397 domain-containing protein n=1 Tax=Streptomyces sp. NPDC003077 TaxID=3154443 RepID=UPI0033A8C7E9